MYQYYRELEQHLRQQEIHLWADALQAQVEKQLSVERFGDLPQWQQVLENLPDLQPQNHDLKSSVTIGSSKDCTGQEQSELEHQLRQLIPWRKGPYSLFDIEIDTEWRSDWKWDRLLPHIQPLRGKTVLDVGCGNGYHCWRMLGEGAKRVIGVDPSPRFVIQFLCIKYFLQKIMPAPADVVPVGLEALPDNLQHFDTTFSMGVLYHRRSPMDHLRDLKATLKSGGELVLETLIIEGQAGECLVPEDRYAMMNNVWFLPSAPTLLSWLKKCGFKNCRVVDINQTTTKEQRSTDWMHWQSLPDFLDPQDSNKTFEGHPAPLRGIFVAQKP